MTRFVLLEDGPRRMEFVLVDGDGGCGRQNDGLVTTEETTLKRGWGKRTLLTKKGTHTSCLARTPDLRART
jgi:hypothetical protein